MKTFLSAIFPFLFLASFPLVVGCDTKPKPEEDSAFLKPLSKDEVIVANVYDRKITFREFGNYLQRIGKLKGSVDAIQMQSMKKEYLLRYIERILFLKEAARKAIKVTDKEILEDIGNIMKEYPDNYSQKSDWANKSLWKEEIRVQLMIKKLIHQEVHDKIEISVVDMKKYYKAHKEDFNREEMVRVRQIVVDTEKEANELRKKILSGKNFIKLAKKFSQSPDRDKGGDLGFFKRGQMPVEFDEAAFSLKKKGNISPVFRSDYGYHIFQLIGKRSAKKLKFNEVKDKIRDKIMQQREEEGFKLWFSNLKQKANIKINTSFL
jgi:parvulin-like peptidyl-prolyl isomerase